MFYVEVFRKRGVIIMIITMISWGYIFCVSFCLVFYYLCYCVFLFFPRTIPYRYRDLPRAGQRMLPMAIKGRKVKV